MTLLKKYCFVEYQLFSGMSFSLSLSDVFLLFRVGLWVFRKKISEVKYHSYYITSGVDTNNFAFNILISEGRNGENKKVEFKSITSAVVKIAVKIRRGN